MTNQKQLQKSFIQEIEEENNIEAQKSDQKHKLWTSECFTLTLAKNLERH